MITEVSAQLHRLIRIGDTNGALAIIDDMRYVDAVEVSHLATALLADNETLIDRLSDIFKLAIYDFPGNHIDILTNAIVAGNVNLVSRFLDSDRLDQTLLDAHLKPICDSLRLAVQKRNLRMITLFMEHPRFTWTVERVKFFAPLYVAAEQGHFDLCHTILESELIAWDDETKARVAFGCLEYAIKAGHTETVDKFLLIPQVDEFIQNKIEQTFTSAIFSENKAAVTIITSMMRLPRIAQTLKESAETMIKRTDADTKTRSMECLEAAVEYNRVDICKAFFDIPEMRQMFLSFNVSVMQCAVRHNALPMLKYLLELSGELDAASLTRIVRTAIVHDRIRILEILLDLPFSRNALGDLRIYVSMCEALENNDAQTVKFLLDLELPETLTHLKNTGYALLQMAVMRNRVACLEKLLNNKEILSSEDTHRAFLFKKSTWSISLELYNEYFRKLTPADLVRLDWNSHVPLGDIRDGIVAIQKELSSLYKCYMQLQKCLPGPGLAGPTRLVNEYLFGKDQIVIPDFHATKHAMTYLFGIHAKQSVLLERTIERMSEHFPDQPYTHNEKAPKQLY